MPKKSSLGKLVSEWELGAPITHKEFVKFLFEGGVHPSQIESKEQLQSLVTHFIRNRKKEENEEKEQKDSQEIVELPENSSEEEQDKHGGDDTHKDIEDSEQKQEQSSENSESSSESSDGSKQQNTSSNDNETSTTSDASSDSSLSSETISGDETGVEEEGNNNSVSDLEQEISKYLEHSKKEATELKKLDTELEKQEATKPGTEMTPPRGKNTSRHIGYGGGGARMADAKDADIVTFRLIQTFLTKLATDKSPMGKEEGKDKWDPVKIIKSRFNGALKNAKFSRPCERNIWFIIDDSGSVSMFAEFIVSMLQGASNIVNVLSGSEAKPCRWYSLPKVNRPKAIRLYEIPERFVQWEQKFRHSFIECLQIFIRECRVQHGDVFVFWGDLMDALQSGKDTPQAFRKLLRPYQCYWLLCHDGRGQDGWSKNYRGNHTKIIEDSRAFKILYDINNAQSLRKAISRLK